MRTLKTCCVTMLLIAAAAGCARTPNDEAQTLNSQSAGINVVDSAADALGGKSKVLNVKSLQIYGYGQNAYQDGGGNVSSSPHAAQKWVNINGRVRAIDYEHGRMHTTERLVQDFVFAYARNMDGRVRQDQYLDGTIAFNMNADGRLQRASETQARTRRIEMLDNPLSIVRAALMPGAKLGPVREASGDAMIDLTTAQEDTVTVAFSLATHLPDWMRWHGPHANFGDVTYTTYFTGYQPSDGFNLPSSYNTVSDFREVVQEKIYVDKYEVDRLTKEMSAQMAAPTAVATAPMPPAPAQIIEPTQVAPHVWYMHSSVSGSSTAFEFGDHVTLFEAYGSEANFEAILQKTRETIPGKPVTQLIVSHHHIDHTGGLRAAVAEGLTVITNRGDNEAYVREVTSRPAPMFPDLLQTKGRIGSVMIMPVDDMLVLKDPTLEVDVYRVVNNSHYAEGLLAYVPAAHTVSEGDLVDEGWDIVWWGNSYPDSVKAWHLTVDKDLPVHGHMHAYSEVLSFLEKQIENARALCAKADAAGLTLQGCPVSNTIKQ